MSEREQIDAVKRLCRRALVRLNMTPLQHAERSCLNSIVDMNSRLPRYYFKKLKSRYRGDIYDPKYDAFNQEGLVVNCGLMLGEHEPD